MRLESSRLYLLLTRALCRLPPDQVLEQALRAGVDVIQVREPGLPAGPLLDWTRAVCTAAEPFSVPVLVNDRPDVALMAGASGVHVGQEDLPARGVRDLIGPDLLLGLSTHGRADVERARSEPVDYIGVGPLFDTATKGKQGLGLPLLDESLGRASVPAFGIGGIDRHNLAQACAAGLRRAAVSSAVCGSEQPGEEVAALLAILNR